MLPAKRFRESIWHQSASQLQWHPVIFYEVIFQLFYLARQEVRHLLMTWYRLNLLKYQNKRSIHFMKMKFSFQFIPINKTIDKHWKFGILTWFFIYWYKGSMTMKLTDEPTLAKLNWNPNTMLSSFPLNHNTA